jgi:protein disulfide-isomerase
MKKILTIFVALGVVGNVCAAEANWLTSYPEALERGAREQKLLLLDFTGSDWCGWCQRLDAEVFSRAEFIAYANNNLVLVKVDFPMHPPLPDALKKANHALKKKYGVEGFPSLFLVKPDERVMWDQRGYAPGGPNLIIDSANQCRKAMGWPLLASPAPAKSPAIAPMAPAPQTAPVAPPARKTPGSEPKLQAIFYSSTHPSVILGGITCEEGDVVAGMRVVKIARDKVTVELEGQTKSLRMN